MKTASQYRADNQTRKDVLVYAIADQCSRGLTLAEDQTDKAVSLPFTALKVTGITTASALVSEAGAVRELPIFSLPTDTLIDMLAAIERNVYQPL